MALMGYREYSRHAGVTLRAVQKAIEAGYILISAEKKIDSDQADRGWKESKEVNRPLVSMTGAPSRPLLVEVKPESENRAIVVAPPRLEGSDDNGDERDAPESAADATTSEYRTHRASREKYSSLKQELEYKQLAGELIAVDEAKQIVSTAFRAIRDSVLNVAARLKDQLAAENDPHECERLIDAELSAALAGIDVARLLQETDE